MQVSRLRHPTVLVKTTTNVAASRARSKLDYGGVENRWSKMFGCVCSGGVFHENVRERSRYVISGPDEHH